MPYVPGSYSSGSDDGDSDYDTSGTVSDSYSTGDDSGTSYSTTDSDSGSASDDYDTSGTVSDSYSTGDDSDTSYSTTDSDSGSESGGGDTSNVPYINDDGSVDVGDDPTGGTEGIGSETDAEQPYSYSTGGYIADVVLGDQTAEEFAAEVKQRQDEKAEQADEAMNLVKQVAGSIDDTIAAIDGSGGDGSTLSRYASLAAIGGGLAWAVKRVID